jgi:hypothetical protein
MNQESGFVILAFAALQAQLVFVLYLPDFQWLSALLAVGVLCVDYHDNDWVTTFLKLFSSCPYSNIVSIVIWYGKARI